MSCIQSSPSFWFRKRSAKFKRFWRLQKKWKPPPHQRTLKLLPPLNLHLSLKSKNPFQTSRLFPTQFLPSLQLWMPPSLQSTLFRPPTSKNRSTSLAPRIPPTRSSQDKSSAKSPGTGLVQIGRASCRERV